MTRKRKMNGSLLRRIMRRIISIGSFLLKLLGHLEKKTILLGVSIIFVVGVSVTIVFIVKGDPSRDLPTPSPTSDINPEVQPKNSNILDPKEPKDIQKSAESGTQRTEKKSFAKELKDIRERVKSGTQHMEDMRKSVKAVNEDVKKMTEKAEKMKEKVDGRSED